MAALDSQQLKCMINCDFMLKEKVIGVIPADWTFPLPCNKGLIVNTHPHNYEGEHWISIFNVNNDFIDVFDSLGNLSDKDSIKFGRISQNLPVRYNQRSVQCTNSFLCGYYCIFYHLCRAYQFEFDTLMYFFRTNCIMNDIFVFNFVINTFPLCLSGEV